MFSVSEIAPQSGLESLGKEGEHALERDPRRMSRFIDEVGREHRVRNACDAVSVARMRVDLDRLEPIAKLAAQPLESRAGAHQIGGEAKAEHRASFRDPSLHGGERFGGEMKCS